MFAVLEVCEGDTSLKGRFLDYIKSPVVTSEAVSIPNSFSFYKIKAQKYRGEIPWEAVSSVAGKLRSRLVLPNDVTAPNQFDLKSYKPTVLPLRILMNSALKSLRMMRLDPVGMYVTVIDENAFLMQKVYELAGLASMIRVITKCTYEYERLAEKMMHDFGISLLISGRMEDSVLQSTVIISDKSAMVPLIFGGLLFTNERRRLMNSTVLVGEGLTLPKKYEKLLPEKTNRLAFVSALYELCAADELADLNYDKIITYR